MFAPRFFKMVIVSRVDFVPIERTIYTVGGNKKFPFATRATKRLFPFRSRSITVQLPFNFRSVSVRLPFRSVVLKRPFRFRLFPILSIPGVPLIINYCRLHMNMCISTCTRTRKLWR